MIMTGMTSYFVNQLGVEVSTAQIENVAQTDLHETLIYCPFPFLLWCLLTVVLPVVVLSFLQINPNPLKKSYLPVASLVVALAVMGGRLIFFL